MIYNEPVVAKGETWAMPRYPEATSGYDRTFTCAFKSNGERFESIRIQATREKTGNLDKYGNKLYNANVYYGTVLASGGVDWNGGIYRTVTFSIAPSGELLEWLEEFATKK